MRLLGAVAVLSFLGAFSASAASYYVSPTGNDAASGALDAPFRTIKQATRVVRPGDVVNVRGGVYYEATAINQVKGTAAAPIVIRSMPGEQAILDGSKLTGSTSVISLNENEYVDLDGFEVRNGPHIGVTVWFGKNVRILNNTIHHFTRNGIYVGGDVELSCTDITLSGNQIHDTVLENQYHTIVGGGWATALMVSRTERTTITRNRIWNNDGEGLTWSRGSNATIRDNEVFDNFSVNLYVNNGRNGIISGNLIYSTGNTRYYRDGKPGAGISVANETFGIAGASDNLFTNNIIVGTRWGFHYGSYDAGGGLRNTKVLHNTFYGTTEEIVRVENDTHANSLVANNVFYQTVSPAPKYSGSGAVTYANNLWYGGTAGVASGTGDAYGNPQFVRAGSTSAADYKLTATSAAIGAGQNLTTTVTQDYFGGLRKTPVDVGAHQFSSGVIADSTAPTIPSNLRPLSGTSASVSLAWDAATDNVGVTGYIVLRDGVVVATVSGLSWTDGSVLSRTLYAYQVQAVDAAGNKSAATPVLSLAWSSSSSEALDTEAPSAPALYGAAASSTSIGLDWTRGTDNVGIDKYRVYRDGLLIVTTSKRGMTDTGLLAGTSYTYTVVAVDEAGNVSPLSNTLTIKTPTSRQRAVR